MYVYILIDRYTIQYGAMNRWGKRKIVKVVKKVQLNLTSTDLMVLVNNLYLVPNKSHTV